MMNEGWYNLQCPWNAMEYQSRKHEFAAKKRLNGSRILGGSYTPNAKGSRSCKGTVSQPYDSSWSLQPLGSQIFAMTQERQSGTGKTWQNCGVRKKKIGATLEVNDLNLMINHWNVHEWLFSFDHGFLQGAETVKSHVSWFWISLAS